MSSLFCRYCLNPQGFNLLNPLTQKGLQFEQAGDHLICEICADVFTPGNFPDRHYFDQEWQDYLNNHKRIIFAFSGGLDSTVVLTLLAEECRKKDIELRVFSLDHGCKGKIAMANITRVIEHLGIQNNFELIDISEVVQSSAKVIDTVGKAMPAIDVYLKCFQQGILPCGPICNSILDNVYIQILKDKGFNELITGGDTPKKNKEGKYSLFWHKPSGLTIVRGGYAYNLSKKINKDFTANRKIPWQHTYCGGYDTDCLVPGAWFANFLNGNPRIDLPTLVEKLPIILEYLTERTRFGIFQKDEATSLLANVDIASYEAYIEFIKLLLARANNNWPGGGNLR